MDGTTCPTVVLRCAPQMLTLIVTLDIHQCYVSMPPHMHQTISWEVGDTRVRNSRSFFLRPPPPVEHISTCSLSSMRLEDSTPVKSLSAKQAKNHALKRRHDNQNQGIQQRVRRKYRKFGHTWLDVVRRGDLCLKPSVRQRVQASAKANELNISVDCFAKSSSLSLAPRWFGNRQGGALAQNWQEECLWVAPPPHLYRCCVEKICGEGCHGFMLLPTRKQHHWWWAMGKLVVDWVDIGSGSDIFESVDWFPIKMPDGESY